MFHRSARRLSLALVLAMVASLAVAAAALAGSDVPTLLGPHKARRGHVRLVVRDTGPDARKYGVFVTINRHKQFDKFHHLKNCKNVAKGCQFIQLKRWKGHPGLWTETGHYDFPGYWATTPGRYFWQAQVVGNGAGGLIVSNIKSFRII